MYGLLLVSLECNNNQKYDDQAPLVMIECEGDTALKDHNRNLKHQKSLPTAWHWKHGSSNAPCPVVCFIQGPLETF